MKVDSVLRAKSLTLCVIEQNAVHFRTILRSEHFIIALPAMRSPVGISVDDFSPGKKPLCRIL